LLETFTDQYTALAAGCANVALLETMSDPPEVGVGIKAARQVGDWPVVCTYAYQKANGVFRSMMGTTLEAAVDQALEDGADIVGANCGTDLSLDDYRALADELLAAADGKAPVILQPNAGAPRQVNGQAVYDATPADMAQLAADFVSRGIKIVGGCCGTSPDHLKAMSEMMI